MGYYLFDGHEVGRTKLELLRSIPGAVPSSTYPLTDFRHFYPVCWINSGAFEAVGIAIDAQELDRFVTGMHGRPHQWFVVPTEELVKLKPHLTEYLRRERSWQE